MIARCKFGIRKKRYFIDRYFFAYVYKQSNSSYENWLHFEVLFTFYCGPIAFTKYMELMYKNTHKA